MKCYNFLLLSFLFFTLFSSEYISKNLHHHTLQLPVFEQKQPSRTRFRSTPIFPIITRCYVPSVKECKILTSEQIMICFMQECGGGLHGFHNKILKLYPYYVCDNFIKVVKQFPEYAAFIFATAKRTRKNWFFRKYLKWHKVRDIFLQLEKELIAQQELEKNVAPIKSTMQTQESSLRNLQRQYRYENKQNNLLHRKRQERLNVIDRYFAGEKQYYEQQYALSYNAQQLLRQHYGPDIFSKKFTCLGNVVQQHAYKECVDVINTLSQHASVGKINNLDKLVLSLSELGLHASSSGLVTQTYTITDFCWSVLDCGVAFGEGVGDGVLSVINTVLHPIDTVIEMTQGIYQIASTLSSIIVDVCDINITHFTNPDAAQQKQDALVKEWSDFANLLWQKAKNTQVRDYFRFGTAFITETVLLGKCAKVVHEFVHVNKTRLLKKVTQPRSIAFVTAEGVPVYVGVEAGEVARAEKMAAEKMCSGSKKIKGKKNKKGNSNKACNVNAQIALDKKMRALQGAQRKALKIVDIGDGRIRYYEVERSAKKLGPTRGASYVTEYNTNTGQVRSWLESYDHFGNVNRVHPKMIDGQDIIGQHYPPTKAELNSFFKKSRGLR